MAYARFGDDSDVYVLQVKETHGPGWPTPTFWCMSCRMLGDYRTHETKSARAMRDHLLEHISQGHKVPEHAMTRLERVVMADELRKQGGDMK